MKQLNPGRPADWRTPAVAWGIALLAGFLGLAPHLAWSLENHAPSWFFNSYDEGFYGWLALNENIYSRVLSTFVMRALLLLAGGSTQLSMILADFFLPLCVVLAACYAVRPLFCRPMSMAAAALFLTLAPEVIALRSTFTPHAAWHDWLWQHGLPLFGGPSGWLQIDNRTATFWLFRTPEPQVSLGLAFLVLGLALRILRDHESPPRVRVWFVAASLLLGLGYMFTALSISGVLMLYGVLAYHRSRRVAVLIGSAGAGMAGVCLLASWAASTQFGGDKFLFPSRAPVLLLSAITGTVAALVFAVRCLRQKQIHPPHLFGFSLALTPLVIANQQLLTGRMIYLMNFENFGLAALAGFAVLMTFASWNDVGRSTVATARDRWGVIVPTTTLLGLVGLLGRAQWLSYQSYLAENRMTESYVRAARVLVPPGNGETLVCGDFFVTDILAVKLGYRPNHVLCRDTTFLQPVKRLVSGDELPANGAGPRHALFRYLAACGIGPQDFGARLAAVIDPAMPDWKSRFMLGAFLYNQADFWAPMTHARDLRSDWLAVQRPRLIRAYEDFLATPDDAFPDMLALVPEGAPAPLLHPRQHAKPVGRVLGTPGYPLTAYRCSVEARP